MLAEANIDNYNTTKKTETGACWDRNDLASTVIPGLVFVCHLWGFYIQRLHDRVKEKMREVHIFSGFTSHILLRFLLPDSTGRINILRNTSGNGASVCSTKSSSSQPTQPWYGLRLLVGRVANCCMEWVTGVSSRPFLFPSVGRRQLLSSAK